MRLTPVTADESAYLVADDVIDHTHPLVRETAARLRARTEGRLGYAHAAFAHVRDTIPHAADVGDPRRGPWRASEVLAARTGICHTKSHALAALLRAEGIPAGFCYQRLDVLHGLLAVRVPGTGRWVRQDPRGNKPGVDARFSTGREQLAWPVRPECGECDYPLLYDAPHPVVLRALRTARDREHLWQLLPAAL
ncbi:transglutaminase family protein [Streptomyces sp. HNM0574]|uniref:transglutaminase-like domain-containing protein n=1 Tax=Streptomyces sp. HNM0574 TaxID=2714954 RepID=UPI00146EE185|nr:transglutaminase family protein [Streptomyces sp. HNM0574]NLU68161.1 transglutaminase family protein [Streptomyces sp. HNM0574]